MEKAVVIERLVLLYIYFLWYMMIYYAVVTLFIKIIALSGCYVEGVYLRNQFQWKDTIGP